MSCCPESLCSRHLNRTRCAVKSSHRGQRNILEPAEPSARHFRQGHRIEIVPLAAPVALGSDQFGRFEHGEVLGHRLPRHRQIFGQSRERQAPLLAQPIEQEPTRWIRKSGEGVGHARKVKNALPSRSILARELSTARIHPGRPCVCRSASPRAMPALVARLSDRTSARIGNRTLASTTARTASVTPALSLPNSRTSSGR